MPAALRRLMWLQVRGTLRLLIRRTRSVRGAIFFLLGLALVGLWIAQAVVGMVVLGRVREADPGQLETWGPLGLLALAITVLVSGAENSLAFRPAEIDFLFPAPFTRRQLLLYKLSGRMLAALFSALFFSIWLGRFGASPVFVVVGAWLAMVFVQLLPVAMTMLAQSLATASYSWLRRAALMAVALALAVGFWQALPRPFAGDWQQLLTQFRQAPAVQAVVAPFQVFIATIIAPQVSDFVRWGATGLAIDLVLVAAILWLDANYFEVAAAASRRHQERIAALRRGGLATTRAARGSSGRRLKMFPWLSGAGPIAWRQAVTLLRTSWWLWIIMAMAFSAPMITPLLARGGHDANSARVLAGAAAGILYLTIMFTWTLRCDFRAEVPRMDWLKMLPLPALALAAGELLVPCVATGALQCTIWTAACLYAGAPEWIAAGFALSLPVCGLFFGVENLLFLLFPPQTVLGQPLDLQTFGRQFVLAAVKVVFWVLGAAIVAGPALGMAWLTGGSIVAALAVATIVLLALDAGLLAAMAWAFTRFDVSRDLPAR